MVRAGEMRHEVRIEQRTSTLDPAGQQLDAWMTIAERRAAIQRAPGQEIWASAQRHGRVPTVFHLRYLDGVLPEMRVVLGDRVYDILSAIDPSGRREELVITAEELVGVVPGPPLTGEGGMLVTDSFTTADPIENTFPRSIILSPAGVVVRGVQVARIENLDDPTAVLMAIGGPDWVPITDGLSVKFIPGLEPGVHYRVTLEVLA